MNENTFVDRLFFKVFFVEVQLEKENLKTVFGCQSLGAQTDIPVSQKAWIRHCLGEATNICSDVVWQQLSLFKEMNPQLKNLEWFVCGRKVKVRRGMVALETFGFVLLRPTGIITKGHIELVTTSFCVEINCEKVRTLEDTLHKFWSHESLEFTKCKVPIKHWI